jgi:hypothetical protein
MPTTLLLAAAGVLLLGLMVGRRGPRPKTRAAADKVAAGLWLRLRHTTVTPSDPASADRLAAAVVATLFGRPLPSPSPLPAAQLHQALADRAIDGRSRQMLHYTVRALVEVGLTGSAGEGPDGLAMEAALRRHSILPTAEPPLSLPDFWDAAESYLSQSRALSATDRA